MNKILSEINFSKINWFQTSYGERKGIWNGNLIVSHPFVVSMHPLDENTIKKIHKIYVACDNIFWFHHNDFIKNKIDRDPCDIWEELTGRSPGLDEPPLDKEEYAQNKTNLVAYIRTYLRNKKIDQILE